MKTLKKRLIASVCAIGLAAGLAGCSGSASDAKESPSNDDKSKESSETTASDESMEKEMEPIDVNFGYIPDLNGSALLAIAKAEGLWDKYKININLQTFTNGPLQITALGTGDLDYGYIGNGAFWLPASGKADLACLLGTSLADRVIAQEGIKSIKDLKGKRVGVPEGTSGDTVLSLALEANGMSADDIQRIPMDAPTVVSAFDAGQIDAAGLWYPLIQGLTDKGTKFEELASDEDFEDTMAFPSAIVMRKGLATEDKDKAERVEKVIAEALNFRAENRDKALELIADFSQQPLDKLQNESKYMKVLSADEQLKLWEDGTIGKWLENMGKFFVDKGKVQESDLLDPKDYYQADLLKAANS